jgi:dTMP kinase
VDVELGLSRAHQRNESTQAEARLDQQSLDFHLRVAEGYRRIATLEPLRFRMIEGNGTPADVAERVWSEVSPLLYVPSLLR